MGSTMRAAVIHEPGGPETFQLEDVPIPTPKESEVLIRIRAFGLNRAEHFTREGHSPIVKWPRIIGIECVGEVESCPSGTFNKGDKVATCMGGMGRTFDGSYAEYMSAPVNQVQKINTSLSWEQFGALPEMFQTTWGSLFLSLQLKKGDKLLVRGGTSSIGLAAAAIAKNYGVEVTSTTRKAESEAMLKASGASDVLIDDGNISAKAASRFDKCLELVGVTTMGDSMKCLKRGGICCITGILSGTWTLKEWNPMEYIPLGVCLTIYAGGVPEFMEMRFQELVEQVEKGELKVPVAKVFKLDEIADAHRLMDSNKAGGKIVVVT